jgi:hypothetical protein
MPTLKLKAEGGAVDGLPTEADFRALLPGDPAAWRIAPLVAEIDTVLQDGPAGGWQAQRADGAGVTLLGPADSDGERLGPLDAWELKISPPFPASFEAIALALGGLVVLLALVGYGALLYWLAGFVPLVVLYVVGALGIFAALGVGVLGAIALVTLASAPVVARGDAVARELTDAIVAASKKGAAFSLARAEP